MQGKGEIRTRDFDALQGLQSKAGSVKRVGGVEVLMRCLVQ